MSEKKDTTDTYLVQSGFGEHGDLHRYRFHPSRDLRVNSSGGHAFEIFALHQISRRVGARVFIDWATGGASLLTAAEDVSIHPSGIVGFRKEQVLRWMTEGRFLNAEEAIDFGLANAISDHPQWETP